MSLTLNEIRDDLRLYLRDSSGLNNLLSDGTENSDSQLEFCIRMSLGSFNMTAPISAYTYASFPEAAYIFLIHGAVIEVLMSSGILESRNRINYSNGGLTVADHDKAGPYQSWIQIFQSLMQLMAMKKIYKMTTNIESCYSTIKSEFDVNSTEGWRFIS